jgi:hypothetical protein
MKKIIVLILFVAGLHGINPVSAQTTLTQPFETDFRGTSILAAGFSLGNYGYGFLGNRSVSVPPFTAYYEYGVHQYITIGPSFGYARWSYRYANAFNYSWTFMHIGARGSFHLTSFINEFLGDTFDEETFDIYASVISGIELRNYSANFTGGSGLDYDNDWNLFFGPILGIRYYFNPRLAVFFEGGRGALGVATFGVSTRF